VYTAPTRPLIPKEDRIVFEMIAAGLPMDKSAERVAAWNEVIAEIDTACS
jgi:hypothetical protein